MLNIRIRYALKQDYLFLKIFLYEAIFTPEGEEPRPFSILENPPVSKYIKGWKRRDDIGFMAENDGEIIGAIWARFFNSTEKGYGYVADDIPELSMSILKDYRNNSIGSELLNQLFRELKRKKIAKVSLSVDKRNKAAAFYQKHNFEIVNESGNSLTMLKSI
jgi:ribosomal protein S18 acetylase RimI-like enzyme